MSKKGINRRQFLATTAAGIGALTVLSPLSRAAAMPVSKVKNNWDYETEVLVSGYGAAGAAAAIEAADNGADVLIIEKMGQPGGSAARSGGGIMGAGTSIQKELGIEDSPQKLYDWLMTIGEGITLPYIARIFSENSGKNVDWLVELGETYGVGSPFPVRRGTLEEGGVDALAAPFEQYNYEPTPRSHWAEPKTKGEHGGPEMFYPFYAAINAKGIKQLYDTSLLELITSDDGQEVVGVKAISDGKPIYIKATKGVLLGTGGFPHNKEMKKIYIPEAADMESYMTPAATGDGIVAAQALGAALTNMSTFHAHAGPHASPSDKDAPFFYWHTAEGRDIGSDSHPALVETFGGLVINEDAQVQDVFGRVIPRLYASGCVLGSNVFAVYPGCGCYIGFAVCFGRIAGKNLAQQKAWS